MKLSEFLAAVVPKDGIRIAALAREGTRPGGKKFFYFEHLLANDHDTLRTKIAEHVKQTDVYIALASYRQGFHENAKGKKVVRVRDNVHRLKALWFDIDFKDGLSNPTEVVAALREFSNATGMPVPSVLVHSGNGMHCYWPFQTEVTLDEWLPLANALKERARLHNLPADHVCTGDAARVLRPIGSINWKDPQNPKIVKGASTGRLFTTEEIAAALLGSSPTAEAELLGEVPRFLTGLVDAGSCQELTGPDRQGHNVEHYWGELTKHCGVARYYQDTGGADCSEPEWVASLQLLRHCKDGELYVHDVSKGHPDYDPSDTTEKWQQRLENDAGPTLCDTFSGYRPEICKKCPHRGKIKSPVVLGEEKQVTASGKTFDLRGWRIAEGGNGMEKSVWDKEANQYVWEKVLRRQWELRSANRGHEDGKYTYTVVSTLDNGDITIIPMPGNGLSNTTVIQDVLSEHGVPLQPEEIKPWKSLMGTWLQEMQRQRKQVATVSKLGWIEDKSSGLVKRVGFTAGDTCFYANGTSKTGLRAAEDHREFAKFYTATGEFSRWHEVADFVVKQNNPVFTAVLASAFTAPIISYAGIPGASMTVVSPESGLGKTSAMRLAQSVWSEPQSTMLGPSDTYNSTIGKAAFLKNLPLYWDEIRNEKTLDNFFNTAFDLAQGKERGRMDANAKLKEVRTWRTMVVGASNQSLFDYMAEQSGKSDAGPARTFELTLTPFRADNRAAMQPLFYELNEHYGHAGQLYAKWLAENEPFAASQVKKTNEALYEKWDFSQGERFWCSLISALICGAKFASYAGIVDIDVPTMAQFLKDTMGTLRIRTQGHLSGLSARELVVGYIQMHQQNGLYLDKHPAKGSKEPPMVKSPPQHNKLSFTMDDDGMVRLRKQDFTTWLKTSKSLSLNQVEGDMIKDLNMRDIYARLGTGTKWNLPGSRCLEFMLGVDGDITPTL